MSRGADDQLGLKDDVLVLVVRVRGLVQDELGGSHAEALSRLPDRGQRPPRLGCLPAPGE